MGNKFGNISFNIIGGTISGKLKILNHTENINGTIDRSGYCRIKGNIVTLTRNIDFVAAGKIESETLTLSVKDERNIYEITGLKK